jgi:hypothetical protein
MCNSSTKYVNNEDQYVDYPNVRETHIGVDEELGLIGFESKLPSWPEPPGNSSKKLLGRGEGR